jgi:glycine/D-amino acid oxidase-like deaminating enzyme
MVSLEAPSATISRIVSGAGTYLLPRTAGAMARVWAGATVEDVGWGKRTTAAARTTLHQGAAALVPALEGARVFEHWSGLRPGTPDALPVLGPDPDVAGLFYATGHFRNGILLAPITARLLASTLTGERPSELSPFRIERFDSDPTPRPTGPHHDHSTLGR